MNALETIKRGLSDLVAEAKRRLARGRSSAASGGAEGRDAGAFLVRPNVDVYETPEHVVLFVDLPGVKRSGLRVETYHDRIEIKALRDDRNAARSMSGFVPDGYRVAYRLDATLDPERIDAELRDGVLRVMIGRADAAKPRRIEVK